MKIYKMFDNLYFSSKENAKKFSEKYFRSHTPKIKEIELDKYLENYNRDYVGISFYFNYSCSKNSLKDDFSKNNIVYSCSEEASQSSGQLIFFREKNMDTISIKYTITGYMMKDLVKYWESHKTEILDKITDETVKFIKTGQEQDVKKI